MKILVTRPWEDAERTAKLLKARGHEAVVAPLMEIRFRDGPEISLDDVQAIVVTSANGARALSRRTACRDLPVFAVGPQTAARARALGFGTVKSADGNAGTLARAIATWVRPKDGVLFHARGAQAKGDLAARLAAAGFCVHSEILYDAVEAKTLPPAAAAALASGTLDAVLFYSQRSARIFAHCVVSAGLEEACQTVAAMCIAETVAASLVPLRFQAVQIAVQPDQAGLFTLFG